MNPSTQSFGKGDLPRLYFSERPTLLRYPVIKGKGGAAGNGRKDFGSIGRNIPWFLLSPTFPIARRGFKGHQEQETPQKENRLGDCGCHVDLWSNGHLSGESQKY